MNKKRETVMEVRVPGLYFPRLIVRSEALLDGERDLGEIFLGKAKKQRKKK